MKNLGILSLIGICSSLAAESEQNYELNYNIKAFYKHHSEDGYSQNISGIGIEHNFYQPKGLNIGIAAFTNISQLNPYVEKRISLAYRISNKDKFSFYPFLHSHSFKHKLMYNEYRNIYINKSILFSGLGIDHFLSSNLHLNTELSVFKDIENLMLVHSNYNLTGKKFSNPWGGKVQLGLKYFPAQDFHIGIQGFYSQAFDKCYWQCGGEFSFKWSY